MIGNSIDFSLVQWLMMTKEYTFWNVFSNEGDLCSHLCSISLDTEMISYVVQTIKWDWLKHFANSTQNDRIEKTWMNYISGLLVTSELLIQISKCNKLQELFSCLPWMQASKLLDTDSLISDWLWYKCIYPIISVYLCIKTCLIGMKCLNINLPIDIISKNYDILLYTWCYLNCLLSIVKLIIIFKTFALFPKIPV